jgi:hypothetical protein
MRLADHRYACSKIWLSRSSRCLPEFARHRPIGAFVRIALRETAPGSVVPGAWSGVLDFEHS